MPMRTLEGEGPLARRALRREEMSRFGGELAWLGDPSLIPPEAMTYLADSADFALDPHANLRYWMLGEITEWSIRGHHRLSIDETCQRHQLPEDQVDYIREELMFEPLPAYAPGIAAMSEIVAAVPYVAKREGIGRESWADIASRARAFGAAFAHDGTAAQGLIRDYLDINDPITRGKTPIQLDPAKLKLDTETGITTVTPLDQIILHSYDLVSTSVALEKYKGVCAALQARVEAFEGRTMFDLMWDAYCFATDRYIYPAYEALPVDTIPAQAEPDSNLRVNLLNTLTKKIIRQNTIEGPILFGLRYGGSN